jgi:hypothetical protein
MYVKAPLVPTIAVRRLAEPPLIKGAELAIVVPEWLLVYFGNVTTPHYPTSPLCWSLPSELFPVVREPQPQFSKKISSL